MLVIERNVCFCDSFFRTSIVSHENIVITNETKNKDDPSILADTILVDLFDRAHQSNIPACIRPILEYEYQTIIILLIHLIVYIFSHLDDHKKWIPVDFPKYIFSQIMKSIKVFN